LNKFLNAASFISLQGIWIFFVIMSYFRLNYAGIEESNLNIYYWLLINLITAVVIGQLLLRKRLTKPYLYAILTISAIVIMFYLQDLSSNKYFYRYIAICAPTTLMGVYFSNNKLEKLFPKYFLWMILISLYPLIVSLYKAIVFGISDRYTLDSGAGTIQLGYATATISIFLYYFYLLSFKRKNTFINLGDSVLRIFYNNYFVLTLLLFALLIVVFVGGRGPLVSIISSILLIEMIMNGINLKLIKSVLISAVLIIGVVYIVRNIQIEAFSRSFYRINMLVDSIITGDAFDASSGRDRIYEIAWSHFLENPYWGLGFAGFIKKYNGYPHNIVLEFLADYGLIGSTFLISFFTYVFKPLFNDLRNNQTMILFVAVFLVNLFSLMFSHTFLASNIFWFYFGYGLYMRFGENNNKKGNWLSSTFIITDREINNELQLTNTNYILTANNNELERTFLN